MARLRLPLIGSLEAQLRQPTIDAMRTRLGGREASPPDAGTVVTWVAPDGLSRTGVILAGANDERFLWTSEGVVRRTTRSSLRDVENFSPPDLAIVAGEIRAFASLRENTPVLVDEPGARTEMLLIEKCRFGALVAREDGSVLGVGFRKIHVLRTSD